jgi:hypothetical protein
VNQLSFASLTHANKGQEVLVVPTQIFYVEHDERVKQTHVISVWGAILPVKESVEEVKRRLNEAIQGGTNG